MVITVRLRSKIFFLLRRWRGLAAAPECSEVYNKYQNHIK